MSGIKKITALTIAALTSVVVFGESFRVHKTHSLYLDQANSKASVETCINDAVAVHLPADVSDIQGIELNISIPKEIAELPENGFWHVYSSVSPVPKEGRVDYNGKIALSGAIGNSLSLNVRIPFDSNHSIKKDALSTIAENLKSVKNGYVFITLSPAENLKTDLSQYRFNVTVKPILKDWGKLLLSVSFPPDSKNMDYTVIIDGTPVQLHKNMCSLTSGIHTVSIISDYFRNEVRTVNIEQAKTTELEIIFQDITPLLHIAVPSGSSVYLDDEKIEKLNQDIPLSTGDHSIKFELGGYEVIKSIKAVNGRKYTFFINLDAVITEED